MSAGSSDPRGGERPGGPARPGLVRPRPRRSSSPPWRPASLGWLAIRTYYGDIPDLNWLPGLTLAGLAVVEFVAAQQHPGPRSSAGRGYGPVNPLLVARYAVLAKASSHGRGDLRRRVRRAWRSGRCASATAAGGRRTTSARRSPVWSARWRWSRRDSCSNGPAGCRQPPDDDARRRQPLIGRRRRRAGRRPATAEPSDVVAPPGDCCSARPTGTVRRDHLDATRR